MSGYTADSPKTDGPDYELVRRLAETVDVPVIGEGKIHYPDQAVKMLDAGGVCYCGRRRRLPGH